MSLCRAAELKAKETGDKVAFHWRGYRGIVAANLPPITVEDLEIRLMNALNRISMKSVPETMVK